MASGLGLVYTPIGALKEELSDENGICLPVDDLDSKSIGEAVFKLYQDGKLREKISQVNREQAQQRYDVRVVCPQIVEVYDSIVRH